MEGINSSKVYCKFCFSHRIFSCVFVLIVAKCNVNILFIVLILYSPIILIEADCNTDISISNFKFLYIFLIIFSFFQLSGIIYKTQFTIGVEIDENYKI